MTLLVLCGQKQFDARDYTRFGLKELHEQGIIVRVLDCSTFHNANKIITSEHIEQDIEHKMICDTVELQQELEKHKSSATLVVCLFMGLDETPKIWQLLYGFRTVALSTGCQPTRVLSRLSKVSIIAKRSIVRLKRKINKKDIPALSYWIVSGPGCMDDLTPSFKKNAATKIVFAHSLDYDTYLRGNQDTLRADAPIVIIDQNLAAHPDFALRRQATPATAKEFGGSMRAFIKRLRQKYKKNIVIAAHFTSTKEDMQEIYGDTEILFGQTNTLIQAASLVIVHTSTVMHLAVIYQKPMLLYTTNQLIKGQTEAFSRSCALALNKDRLNLDVSSIENIDALSQINCDAYLSFKQKYVKSKYSPEIFFWQHMQAIYNGHV